MSEQLDNKHVVPREEGWGVKDANGKKASRVFETKNEALQHAKSLAERHGVFMIVHDEDGKFEHFDMKPEVRDQHVVKKHGAWGVVEEGGSQVTKMFDNKGAAMAYAYDLATKHKVSMMVHGEDGKFESASCGPNNSPGLLELFRMKFKI